METARKKERETVEGPESKRMNDAKQESSGLPPTPKNECPDDGNKDSQKEEDEKPIDVSIIVFSLLCDNRVDSCSQRREVHRRVL